MRRVPAILIAAVALAACSPKHETGAASTPGGEKIKAVMADIIEPNAQIYWHSSGYEDTAQGTRDLAPTTPEGWKKAEDSLAEVMEGARLLKTRGYARDKGDWARHVDKTIEQIELSQAATKARDKDAMFLTGGDLYSVCTGCHQQYLLPYLKKERPKKLDEQGTPIRE